VPAGGGRPDGAEPLVEEGHTRGECPPAAARYPRVLAQRWAACPFLSTWLHPLALPATAPAPPSLVGAVVGRCHALPACAARPSPPPDNVSPMLTGCPRESPLVSLCPAERLTPGLGPRWRRGAWMLGRLQGAERWHRLCKRPLPCQLARGASLFCAGAVKP
jgi:hypothetical protein